jgi:hypothetical protein
MATRTDELTAQIQTTRGRMDRTLDDIGDRAGPGRLTDRLKGAVSNTRDTVMGVAGDTGESAADSAADATGAVKVQSKGNPLAAGLVAFGTGLLAGSVLPESRTENKVAREVQSKAQAPLREQVQQSASAVTDQVGERVGEAKDHVAEEGRQAKDGVASDVSDRTDAVKGHAQGAADDVRRDVADQARRHTGA